VQSGTIELSPSFWVDMNKQTSTEGTINQPTTFDGYTCIDGKEKLGLTSTSGYI